MKYTSSSKLVIQLCLKIWLFSAIVSPVLYFSIMGLITPWMTLSMFLVFLMYAWGIGIAVSLPPFFLLICIAYPIVVFIKEKVLLKKILLIIICTIICWLGFLIIDPKRLFNNELPMSYFYIGIQVFVILLQTKSKLVYYEKEG